MFGTLPTFPWDESFDQDLFVGEPDEEGEIQWKEKKADFIKFPGLCEELNDFLNTFYYWQLRGEDKGNCYYFPSIPNKEERKKVVEQMINDGNYYFKNENCVLIANCISEGIDTLLLFYNQEKNLLFIYDDSDSDKNNITPLKCSLTELISSMEAIL